MTKPEDITFLMVGCQRCGTTWVDAALREHLEIYLPEQKQSYFFDRNYDRGMDWYLGRFDAVNTKHKAVGEVATGYSLPHAVQNMAKHLPHVKIIMAMRNPIERAYSNYRVRYVEEGWSSFEDALEKSPDLLERGQYADQIEHLLHRASPLPIAATDGSFITSPNCLKSTTLSNRDSRSWSCVTVTSVAPLLFA